MDPLLPPPQVTLVTVTELAVTAAGKVSTTGLAEWAVTQLLASLTRML